MKTQDKIIAYAQSVLDIEIEGMEFVKKNLNNSFAQMVHACLGSLEKGGKIVMCGVGKSGHIGHKIAASLASTGSPAIFLHPIEALHGDIGMLQRNDIMIALSYSGETDELLCIIPAAKRLGAMVVSITGGAQSRLAQCSDIVVPCNVPREACPFNLAPTTTALVTLAIGDALAMVLLKSSGFTREDFGRLHPGGAIGRAVTLCVREIMRTGHRLALVSPCATVKETLLAMTKARSGSAVIVNEKRELLGIFTDGDFRRRAESDINVLAESVESVMTKNPVTVRASALVVEVLKIFEGRRIDDIAALEDDGTIAGMVDIQDLPSLKLF